MTEWQSMTLWKFPIPPYTFRSILDTVQHFDYVMISLIPTNITKMHPNQKQRLIQEICVMLKLPQPTISTTIYYYRQFTSAQPEQSEHSNEVIVCACIYLCSKVYEQQRKIRDILNIINVMTKLYQMGCQQSHAGYINIETVINSQENLQQLTQPCYQLSMYNKLKKQVIEVEQALLRIVKFDFEASNFNTDSFKQLLVVCDKLRMPKQVTQVAIYTFNDLEFAEKVVKWIPGIIYFSVEVNEADYELKAEQEASNPSNRIQPNPNNHIKQSEQQQNRQPGEDMKLQTTKDPQQMIIQVDKEEQTMTINQIEWQTLFLVPIRKFEAYSQRIASYYEMLTEEETQRNQ